MIAGALRSLCKEVPRIVPAMKPQVVFVLGGPGAGKGTQCAKIVEVCSGDAGSRAPHITALVQK